MCFNTFHSFVGSMLFAVFLYSQILHYKPLERCLIWAFTMVRNIDRGMKNILIISFTRSVSYLNQNDVLVCMNAKRKLYNKTLCMSTSVMFNCCLLSLLRYITS